LTDLHNGNIVNTGNVTILTGEIGSHPDGQYAPPIVQENGNISYTLGNLEIITGKQGYIVTTMVKKERQMKKLDNLLSVCQQYLQMKLTIEEFQSRLITAAIPDNLSKEFIEALTWADNEIESAIFCLNDEDKEKQGKEIASKLIEAINNEKGEQ